jgi:hypothetical protein
MYIKVKQNTENPYLSLNSLLSAGDPADCL